MLSKITFIRVKVSNSLYFFHDLFIQGEKEKTLNKKNKSPKEIEKGPKRGWGQKKGTEMKP